MRKTVKMRRTTLPLLGAVALASQIAAQSTTIPIAPGVNMPIVNLGGHFHDPGNFSLFLELGGRGLDSALSYGTSSQEKVGAAIRSGSVPRNEIFITTKVMCCPRANKTCDDPRFANLTVAQQVDRDLKELGVDQVDLLLLHFPCDLETDTGRQYLELEAALTANKTRAIGVSNFQISDYKAIERAGATVTPAVNQCAMSVGLHDDATIAFSIEHNITYQAYSPLGGFTGMPVLTDPDVIRIAGLHNVTAAQVALRWVMQRQAAFVTAGTKRDYLAADLDVFSFALSQSEMELLNAK